MLRIAFRNLGMSIEGKISYVSDYFDAQYEQSWFQSPLAKEIIRDIDQSEYISGEYIESPLLGGMPPTGLSTGCKSLLLLLNEDGAIVSGERMGDNCFKWVLEIAKVKDITITLNHGIEFEEPFEVLSMNTGRVLTNNLELFEEIYMDCDTAQDHGAGT